MAADLTMTSYALGRVSGMDFRTGKSGKKTTGHYWKAWQVESVDMIITGGQLHGGQQYACRSDREHSDMV